MDKLPCLNQKNGHCNTCINCLERDQEKEFCTFCDQAEEVLILKRSLCNLLEWAKGNRGTKSINPYSVPEVRKGLEVIAIAQGRYKEDRKTPDYLNADTKAYIKADNCKKYDLECLPDENGNCSLCSAKIDAKGHCTYGE